MGSEIDSADSSRPRWAPTGAAVPSRGLLRGKIAAITISLAAVAAMVVGGIYYRSYRPAQAGILPATLDVKSLTESGNVRRAAASPDGHNVAYVSRDAGKDELRLLQVATERDVAVLPPSPQRIWSVRFSPDGNFIYFLRQTDSKDPDIRTEQFESAAVNSILKQCGPSFALLQRAGIRCSLPLALTAKT
jgi:dipeptidyl aminopeptidase/acylaminoacyl peptidase